MSGKAHHMAYVITIIMYIPIFESIGLSPNEAKIYESLLFTGETGISTIATKSAIHRRNVYDSLERLIEKGLVYRIIQRGGDLFRAVAPRKLLEMVDEKRQKLQSILPRLEQIYEAIPTEEAAFIYRGLEGYKNYRRDLIRVSETTYFLGAKALWNSPKIDTYLHEEFKKSMEEKQMEYFTIFDPRVPTELPEALTKVGGAYKVLPEGYSTPGVVDIFGDHIVTFAGVDVGYFGEDSSIFVMKNRDLAESYKTWFKFIWDHSPYSNNS